MSPHLNQFGVFACDLMEYIYLRNLVKGTKTNEREKILFPNILTIRSLRKKSINKRHHLSFLYYCDIFPHIRHGITIVPLVVQKMLYLYRLNIRCNILDQLSKRKNMMRIKAKSNKVILTEFVINF